MEVVDDADDGREIPQTQKYNTAGFYVYDISQLCAGKVERYKLASAIGGQSNFVASSSFSNRFSFISNFNHLTVIPIPHLNLVGCVGMSSKTDYLIWREINGFFTALDKSSNLYTWSTTSGKLLYNERQKPEDEGHATKLKDYEIFIATAGSKHEKHKDDITYTHDFYNG